MVVEERGTVNVCGPCGTPTQLGDAVLIIKEDPYLRRQIWRGSMSYQEFYDWNNSQVAGISSVYQWSSRQTSR